MEKKTNIDLEKMPFQELVDLEYKLTIDHDKNPSEELLEELIWVREVGRKREEERYEIIMLPSSLVRGDFIGLNTMSDKLYFLHDKFKVGGVLKAKHLFVLDNESDIEDGDYYYNDTSKRIYIARTLPLYDGKNTKLIAGTNKSFPIAKLEDAFTRYYCFRYNAKQTVKFVEVEKMKENEDDKENTSCNYVPKISELNILSIRIPTSSTVLDEIIKTNKLIAEFMSIDMGEHEILLEKWGWFDDRKEKDFSKFQYHSSWDWLMPVIKSIRGNELFDKSTTHTFNKEDKVVKPCNSDEAMIQGLFTQDINLCYDGAVEFIKWHNENKEVKNVE